MTTSTHAGARHGWWLAALVGLHVWLGLLYDRATPIFEAPDEGYHFAVARWIALGNGLPVQNPANPGPWRQEGSQPPLYHALVAGLIANFDLSDWDSVFVTNPFVRHNPGTFHNANQYRHTRAESKPYAGTVLAVHAARWLSLALSAVTLVLAHALARSVLPGQPWVAFLAAALAALNPQALFINAAVNNDNLLMLLSTLALLLTVRLMQPEAGHFARDAAALGVVLGLAALTKVSGLVLWPVAALGVAWGAWCARSWRRLLLGGAVVAVLALAISGWWLWRNQSLYGEWLGLNTMVAVAGPRNPPITLPALLRDEWYGFFISYWGVFGVFSVSAAPWVYAFYGGLTAAAAVGGAWAALRRPVRANMPLLLLGLFCLLTLAGVIRWTLQTSASQGRLLFGALAPLSILLAAGLVAVARPLLQLRAGRGWARGFALTLSAALALMAGIVPAGFIAPAYAPPLVVDEAGLPPDLRPVHVVYGESIELVGYTASDAALQPGGVLTTTLYWRARQPMNADYVLALHLFGRDVAEVGRLDTWPGGGNAPTSQWLPGEIMADTYYLPVAADAEAPTLLRLDAYFWADDPLTRLAPAQAGGTPLPSLPLHVVGRLLPEAPLAAEPQNDEGTRFEHGIVLAGYDLHADDALYLTLYWDLQSGEPVPADYTVFVHVVDEEGQPLAQGDGPPLNGDWPTSAWQPGHLVADRRVIPLPPGQPGDLLNVHVGLYDLETGARLLAALPDGQRWPDDAVVLPGVRAAPEAAP